jgi:hypothetical protein
LEGNALIILLVVFALVAVTGLTLLISGLIGQRIGSEPRCGSCGYDLTGRGSAGDCPECGRSLVGNIALGTRRVRRWRAAVGGVLVVITLLVIGSALSTGGMLRRLPTAWLVTVHERIAFGAHRSALFNELTVRITAGSLRREQIEGLLARVIERQRAAALDPASSAAADWSSQEADFVWSAAIAGLTNDAEFESFMVHAVDVRLAFDPTLEPGVVRPRFRISAPRGFTLVGTTTLPQSVWVSFEELAIGDHKVPGGFEMSGGAFVGGSSTMGPTALGLAPPADGSDAVPATGIVTIRLGATERRFTVTARAPILREPARVDRGALARRLADGLVISAVKRAPTEIEIMMQSEADGLDLAEPPVLLGAGGEIVCGTWSRSGGETEQGRWKLLYQTVDPDHLGDGPLRFRIESIMIVRPLEGGFVGRASAPPTEVTVQRPGP